MSVLPKLIRTIGVVGLVAVMSGAGAATPGAKCPSDTGAADFTPEFSNNVLRCKRRDVATPVCPPTHLNYVVKSGKDQCATVNIGTAPPGNLTASPKCGPGMSYVNDGGSGNRDQCRGNQTNVVPLLGQY